MYALRPAAEVVPMAERAAMGLLGFGAAEHPAFLLAAGVILFADRHDIMDRVLAGAFEDARRRGSGVAFALSTSLRAIVGLRAGRLAEAEEDGRTAVAAMREHPWAVVLMVAGGFRTEAQIERGDLERAERALQRSGLAGALPELEPFAAVLDIRGRLHLARGRVEEGLSDLLECGRRQEAMGARNAALIAWRTHASGALLALGRREEALALAEEELANARRWGAPRPVGMALRALALATGGEEGIVLLREAVDVLEPSGAELELARALADLGAALRRAGKRQAASEPLRRGLDAAHRCGAQPIAERARDELVALGARPRRHALSGVDSLTPSERRVAQMASDGMTNRDIAQALFVTLRTVELHLTHAYQKLDVSSRSELPAALAG